MFGINLNATTQLDNARHVTQELIKIATWLWENAKDLNAQKMKVNQFATQPLENVNYAIHNRVERDVSQLNHAKNNANHQEIENEDIRVDGSSCKMGK